MTAGALRLGRKLALPLDVVTRTTAIVGQRGTGKTSSAVVLVEEAARAGAQAAVVDPTGAWYGLRSSADGEKAGLEVVVFGGHHGDVPLEPQAGAFLARLVIDQGLSVVLDLELMTKAKQVQFVAEFAEELYHRNRTALTLVVDEAHRFAPQQLRDPGGFGARCLGAVTDVVTLGRRKGLGAVLISQRPAKINKDVFEQAEVMVCHRLMGPNDRKAITLWLSEAVGVPTEEIGSLAHLERGEAIVWAPELDVYGRFTIRPKRTFDSSATPEVGAAVAEPRGRADVDLAAIEEAMAATIERAKADDPKALRATIAQLRRELAEQPEPVAPAPEIVEVATLPDGHLDALRAARELADRVAHDAVEVCARLKFMVEDLEGQEVAVGQPVAAAARSNLTAPTPAAPHRRVPVASPPRSDVTAPAGAKGDGPPIKAGARRMLEAVASLHPMPLTRAQVGTLAKVKRTGGTYSTYLGVLKQHGLLIEEGDRLMITQAGFDELGTAVPAPATADQLRELWRDRLKAGARRMLDILIARHPDWVTRADLADAAEITMSGGTFSTYLGMLRTAGLIDEADGQVRAGDVLFMGAGGS